MYLLVLAGLVPIQKVHRLERLIPIENIRLKQESDARNGINVAGAMNDSDSSDNYETEELETSGRDTEYEHNDESSEQENDSSEKEDEATGKKQKSSKNSKTRKRHHVSETGPKRKNRSREKQSKKRHSSFTEDEEVDDRQNQTKSEGSMNKKPRVK